MHIPLCCSRLFHPHLLQQLAVALGPDLHTRLVFERVHIGPLHDLIHHKVHTHPKKPHKKRGVKWQKKNVPPPHTFCSERWQLYVAGCLSYLCAFDQGGVRGGVWFRGYFDSSGGLDGGGSGSLSESRQGRSEETAREKAEVQLGEDQKRHNFNHRHCEPDTVARVTFSLLFFPSFFFSFLSLFFLPLPSPLHSLNFLSEFLNASLKGLWGFFFLFCLALTKETGIFFFWDSSVLFEHSRGLAFPFSPRT